MTQLNGNAFALVELLAVQPLSYVPPIHQSTIDTLIRLGLVRKHDGVWYLTQSGLEISGRTLH